MISLELAIYRMGCRQLCSNAPRHFLTYLRYPFWRNERSRLNGRNTRPREALNQFDFGGERDNRLLVLQAIARSDFDELHPVAASGLLRASCREASSQLELGSPAGPAHSRSKESHRELAQLPAPTLL